MRNLPEVGAFPASHFEMLGPPSRNRGPGVDDRYRYRLVHRRLGPGSVLDVGAYFGDFIDLARRDEREVAGTEVNEARRDFVNGVLGEDLVRIDFRNGMLSTFTDDSYDHVVCMEVLEHTPDDRLGVEELCRVARESVLVTVPFRERIATFPCVHCGNFTTGSGHLHRYDLGAFTDLAPPGWNVAVERPFGSRPARSLLRRLRGLPARESLAELADRAWKVSPRWLLIELRTS